MLLSCVAASVNMLIGVLAASLTTGILTAMIFLLHILLFTSIYVNFSTSHAHTPGPAGHMTTIAATASLNHRVHN